MNLPQSPSQFDGQHTYNVKWTATLNGETLAGEFKGMRADREGMARTHTMLLLTNADGALRRAGWTGMQMHYDITQTD